VRAGSGRANHVYAKLAAERRSFGVQIVNDLHVIRYEADGRDDHVFDPSNA
jgi:hypothetical protein